MAQRQGHLPDRPRSRSIRAIRRTPPPPTPPRPPRPRRPACAPTAPPVVTAPHCSPLSPVSSPTSSSILASSSARVPSLATTCVARAAFSSWLSWRRPRPRARRAAAPARSLASRRSATTQTSRRTLLHPGLEQQRDLDDRELDAVRAAPPATRRPGRRPAGGARPRASELLGRSKTISATRARSISPSGATPRPSARPAAEASLAEQVVDDRRRSRGSRRPARSNAASASDLPRATRRSGRRRRRAPPVRLVPARRLRRLAGRLRPGPPGLRPTLGLSGDGVGEDLLGEVEVGHVLRRWAPPGALQLGAWIGRGAAGCRCLSRLTLSEIRRRSSSISRILTLTSSPGWTTSPGLSTWCSASSEMWTRPSTPGTISTKAPKATTFVTLPSRTSPDLYSLRTVCHGSSWVCLSPSEIRWRSRSMSSTLTLTVSPIESTSEGWLT